MFATVHKGWNQATGLWCTERRPILSASLAEALRAPTAESQRHLIQECPALPPSGEREHHMPSNGTKYWRDKAIEIRASAERTLDALARETLLDIAKKYDLMAKIAAEHE